MSIPPRCNAKRAKHAGECLTQAQVEAANAHLYAARKKSDGTQIFQGYARGSELQWARIWAGKAPGGSSYDFFRYSVFQDPNFKNTGFDYDKDTDRALIGQSGGQGDRGRCL